MMHYIYSLAVRSQILGEKMLKYKKISPIY